MLVFGSIAIHRCFYSLVFYTCLKSKQDWPIFSLSQLFFCCRRQPLPEADEEGAAEANAEAEQSRLSKFLSRPFFTEPFKLVSSVISLAAVSICVTWFVNRRSYYHFVPLDFINACLCIYAIKASGVKSLRLIAFLLSALFFYDLFMVFGTKLLSPNGCSVMIEVGLMGVRDTAGEDSDDGGA